MNKMTLNKYLPLILAVVFYLLIYFIRTQQVNPEADFRANSLDLFPELRKTLDKQISTFLPSPHAELLSGIILGSKNNLPASLQLSLRDTATLHIVVVSGQNLTLLAGFLMGTLAGVLKRRTALIVALGSIIFYTAMTGAQIPVLRAAVMATLAFLAQATGRDKDSIWVLVIAAGGMLLINPYWVAEISFQLSFLATFGVVVVAPKIVSYLKHLPEVIKTDLSITLAAQLMVLPVIAINFHQISLISILANLFVLWTIPFIMILGTINLILALIWQPIATIFSTLVYILLAYFIYVVTFFASLPFAWEYIGKVSWIVWVGYYLILLSVLSFLRMSLDPRREQESK